jgi:histidine ammonia-lyase
MLEFSGQALTLEQIAAVASRETSTVLSERAKQRIQLSRDVIERLVSQGRVVYGVNTGFGKLSDIQIPASQLELLQLNLVRSHASGLGNPLSEKEVRAMMLLRANVLARGNSGCRVQVVETLQQMLECGVHPVIPEKGSVGASGDLAPLAHLALSMIGEGESFYRDKRLPGGEALQSAGIEPIRLAAKEGLALLNGTQAMGGIGALAVLRGLRLAALADVAGAMTLEALLGTPVAFDERLHAARPHSGQIASAAHLRSLLENSEIRRSHVSNDARVQDAYSLRCMPQVHGAVRSALEHARGVIEVESGSATDNPLVFSETGEVLSGGNFHGAPLAMVFDYAAIALTDLMSISERRTDRLVNPGVNEGLPPFLCSHPGISSGYMIAQICAVSLLNEAKILAHPASIDNVPTSGDKEDHVSMGMTAAVKLRQIVTNAEQVLAIEFLAAAEGLDYRAPLRSSPRIERVREHIRNLVPRLTADRPLSNDIQRVAEAIQRGVFDEFMS